MEKKMEKGDALLDRGYLRQNSTETVTNSSILKKSNCHCDHCFKGFRAKAQQELRKLLDDDLRKLFFVLGGLLKYLDRASKEILYFELGHSIAGKLKMVESTEKKNLP